MKTNNIQERNWILYDVGNSAFILLATTIIPIFFNSLAKKDRSESMYLAYWGYATTIASLLVALVGPTLGAFADRKGQKKSLFTIFVFIGVVSCILLPYTSTWLLFLTVYIISRLGFNGSLVFYDSMLIDITTENRIDNVSSLGYAWGYIGSCIPFIACIFVSVKGDVLGLDLSTSMKVAFAVTGLWWLIFTLPLLKTYKQKYTNADEFVNLSHLKNTFKEIKKDRRIYLFLFSFLFYIDGVYTIINMATAYGSSLGLDSNGLILALLVTQIVAFPCAIYFGKISKKYPTDRLIKICIIAYGLIAVYAVGLDKLYEFWILTIAVGMFQGAIQALSRSCYAKIIPPEKSGEYFGIFDIFGKGASIFGTLIVSLITHITGTQQLAIGSLIIMFALGLVLFSMASKEKI